MEKSLANLVKVIEKGVVSDTVTERLTQLEEQKSALNDAIETENVRVSLCEDKHSIQAYFDKFLHADVNDPEIRDQVFEYFVDKAYLYDDKLVVSMWFSEDDKQEITWRDWFSLDEYWTDESPFVKGGSVEFDSVPLQDIPRKPRVGMVGEILVQYHPDANNDAVGTIEAEGCEAILPALSQFFQQGFITADWNLATIGKGTNLTRWASKFGLWAPEQYEKPMRKLLAASERFEAGATVRELMEKVQQIASLGNQAGEGWYLTADMMDMIENGCPNIICAQPFACLPNHVIGKGMFHPLREKYPQANIVGIDYDPGASEVNQLNRIKLMISTALENHNQGDPILHMDPFAGITDPVADVASEVSRRLVPVTPGRRPPLGAMR